VSSRPLFRGAVHWATLGDGVGHEQSGRRPVLLVSERRFNERSGTVIVMPLTTKPQRVGLPFAWELSEQSPFDDRAPSSFRKSWVKISQVRVMSTERLGACIDRRTDDEVDVCLDALLMICGRKVPDRAANSVEACAGPDAAGEETP